MSETVNCPCKHKRCSRHGDCEKCRAFHHAPDKNSLAACERMRAGDARQEKKQGRRAAPNGGKP